MLKTLFGKIISTFENFVAVRDGDVLGDAEEGRSVDGMSEISVVDCVWISRGEERVGEQRAVKIFPASIVSFELITTLLGSRPLFKIGCLLMGRGFRNPHLFCFSIHR